MTSTTGHLRIGGTDLEYRMSGPAPDATPTIVMLHEGLGSIGLWGDFPDRLAAATGLGIFAYSRAGYGTSSPAALPRPKTYLHTEACEVLPRVLDAIGLREGVLVGHSDGGSIAALHAGLVRDPRIRAASLIAPHFMIEDVTVAGVAEARQAYETGSLRQKLARWHRNVDNAFYGWNDAWLDPAFRSWDIQAALQTVTVPLQIVQGDRDAYATLRQLDIARERCTGPLDLQVMPGIGHIPQREAPERTTRIIVDFILASLSGADRA